MSLFFDFQAATLARTVILPHPLSTVPDILNGTGKQTLVQCRVHAPPSINPFILVPVDSINQNA